MRNGIFVDYDFCIRLISIFKYNYQCLIGPICKFKVGGASSKFDSILETFRLRNQHFDLL